MPRAVNMFGTDSPVANRRIHPEQDRTDKQCDSYEQDIPPYEAPYPVDCTTAYRTTYYKVEINIEYRYEYSAFYVEYMEKRSPTPVWHGYVHHQFRKNKDYHDEYQMNQEAGCFLP